MDNHTKSSQEPQPNLKTSVNCKIIPDRLMDWALSQSPTVLKLFLECWMCDGYGNLSPNGIAQYKPLTTSLQGENFRKTRKVLEQFNLFKFAKTRIDNQDIWQVWNVNGLISGKWKIGKEDVTKCSIDVTSVSNNEHILALKSEIDPFYFLDATTVSGNFAIPSGEFPTVSGEKPTENWNFPTVSGFLSAETPDTYTSQIAQRTSKRRDKRKNKKNQSKEKSNPSSSEISVPLNAARISPDTFKNEEYGKDDLSDLGFGSLENDDNSLMDGIDDEDAYFEKLARDKREFDAKCLMYGEEKVLEEMAEMSMRLTDSEIGLVTWEREGVPYKVPGITNTQARELDVLLKAARQQWKDDFYSEWEVSEALFNLIVEFSEQCGVYATCKSK